MNGDRNREVKIAVIDGISDVSEPLAGRRIDLDRIAEAVNDVQVAATIQFNIIGHLNIADCIFEPAVRIVYFNIVSAAVANINVPVRINRDAEGLVKTADMSGRVQIDIIDENRSRQSVVT